MKDEGGVRDVTTVVVIDDQPLFRAGIRRVLEGHAAGCAVVGEAADGAEGVSCAVAHAPAVVVVTVEVGGLAGPETIRALKRQVPGAAVIVLADRADAETLFYAIRYGAAAYLIKDVEPATLADVVR